jgi:NADH:ubiquinone oxidoreductase subunit H
MIMMSTLKALLFLGGWSAPSWVLLPSSTILALKSLIFCFLLVLVRATFPRYRYDQLMDIGWKIFLPISTGFLLLVVGLLICFDALPVVAELNLSPFFDGARVANSTTF